MSDKELVDSATNPWIKSSTWRVIQVACAVTLLVLFPRRPVDAAPNVEPVIGRYVAEEKNHGIELFVRGRVLLGRVAWTKAPKLRDEKNPDPKLRGRNVAGITHIRGFTKDADGVWVGGTLYNPEDGETYAARIRLEGRNRLIIEGRPKVPVIGGLLGRLFGRNAYDREGAR